MIKNYVIEVWDTTQMIMQIGTDSKDRVITKTVTVDDLKKLDSNYIRKNCPELQNDAYLRGRESVFHELEVGGLQPGENADNAYKNGYEDGKVDGMGELIGAIRKLISHVDSSDWEKMGFKFNIDGWGDRLLEILKNYLPSEIITKVKAYEQKQEDNAKRDIQNDLEYLMTQTGMTVDEIATGLKRMVE